MYGWMDDLSNEYDLWIGKFKSLEPGLNVSRWYILRSYIGIN